LSAIRIPPTLVTLLLLFLLMIPPRPSSTLFPYTTLFRSHIAGHIYANQLEEALEFPLMALIVSGGHTELIYMKDHQWKFQCLFQDRKSTRLNSSHVSISYAVFCLKKKKMS